MDFVTRCLFQMGSNRFQASYSQPNYYKSVASEAKRFRSVRAQSGGISEIVNRLWYSELSPGIASDADVGSVVLRKSTVPWASGELSHQHGDHVQLFTDDPRIELFLPVAKYRTSRHHAQFRDRREIVGDILGEPFGQVLKVLTTGGVDEWKNCQTRDVIAVGAVAGSRNCRQPVLRVAGARDSDVCDEFVATADDCFDVLGRRAIVSESLAQQEDRSALG